MASSSASTAISSSIPSDVAAVFALIVICGLVLLLLRHYLPLRGTPAYLLVPVFLALVLPTSIVLLVPIDLASSSGTDTEGARGLWLPERIMVVAWRIAYWLIFALTWYASSVLKLLRQERLTDPCFTGLYYRYWESTWIPDIGNHETGSCIR